MPLYEFMCAKCGHQFEELVTAAEVEEGKIKCPACKSKRVSREFSSFAARSNGSGSSLADSGCGGGGGGFT